MQFSHLFKNQKVRLACHLKKSIFDLLGFNSFLDKLIHSSFVYKIDYFVMYRIWYLTKCWSESLPTLVENPRSQTVHLKGRSLVWLRKWISKAELQANVLKQMLHVVLPGRAAEKHTISVQVSLQTIVQHE